MEIEVGEYVKLERGEIFKIDEDTTNYYNSNKEYITNEVVKHSKRIIDLIEVGDFINKKCVEKIVDYFDNSIEVRFLNEMDWYRLTEEDIETILTHEQFEQNAYRLEEK